MAAVPFEIAVIGGGISGCGIAATERESRYLIDHEWARSAEDGLWRRSKLGLHVSATDPAQLEAWISQAARNARSTEPFSARTLDQSLQSATA